MLRFTPNRWHALGLICAGIVIGLRIMKDPDTLSVSLGCLAIAGLLYASVLVLISRRTQR